MKWDWNNTVTLYMEDDDEEETYRLVTSIRGNSRAVISTEYRSEAILDIKWVTGQRLKSVMIFLLLCGDPKD